MTRPSHPAVLAVPVAIAALAVPASAGATGFLYPPYVPPSAIGTIWAGWDAPATVGVGRPTSVAAGDRTIMIAGEAPSGGAYPFRLEGPSGRRIGRVRGDTPPVLGVAGERRLYATDGCTVRTSTDRGTTWSAAGLPGCATSPASTPPATRIAVLDERVAWVATDRGTWRTTDGGATWGPSSSSPALPVPASADVAYRLTPGIRTGVALERTTDGGATWTPLPTPFPDAAGTPSNGSSIELIDGPHPLVVRADGTLLVGNGDRLLQSQDGGNTFAQHLLPRSLDESDGVPPTIDQLVCDGPRCIVGITGRAGVPRRGIPYADGAFDDRDFNRSDGPPRFLAAAVGDGRIVGQDGDPRTDAVGAPVLEGSFVGTGYGVLAREGDVTGSVGSSGVLALPTSTGATTTAVTASTDHGLAWDEKPPPSSETLDFGATLRRIALLPGDFRASVALSSRNRLSWSQDPSAEETDLGRLGAQDLAVSRGVPVVVGARGIARVASPTSGMAPVTSRIVRGRSFEHVEARGRTVVAWSGGRRPYAVRSTDGGTTWARTTLPTGVDAVEVATERVVYALAGRTLHRSVDGGRRFTRRVVTPALGDAGQRFDGDAAPQLAFSSADRGALVTPSGAFVTADGGGGVSPIPTPGAVVPSIAEVARGTVTIQDAITGAVLRSPGLLDRPTPSLALRVVGRPRAGARGARTVTVSGRLSGVGAGEPVALVGHRSRAADRPLLGVARTDASGRFRARVRLSAAQGGVQAWFRGSVTTDRTVRSKVGAVLRVR
ncbi:unannotated protein [freshwater metagenome]|uniref:Unannotated protein n=1 Tax=freshwater metagenome TaxID=449393 RepID=A0A6J7HTX4_9ZZZZ|nr:hypothetical protein [Actinomycetota bacterium]